MTVIHLPQQCAVDTSTARLTGLTGTETEALVRFAAEFLYRAGWSKATPEGLEKAYLDTIPVDCGDEDLHVYMQLLGQRAYVDMREDFKLWAYRTIPVDEEK
jgi:hypothetical protein